MGSADMVQVRQFLFVLWDGGGNVPPQLAVVRHRVSRPMVAPWHLVHACRVLARQSFHHTAWIHQDSVRGDIKCGVAEPVKGPTTPSPLRTATLLVILLAESEALSVGMDGEIA